MRIGGIVGAGLTAAKGPLNGGPQMVEISRDGKRTSFHQLALRRGRSAILSRGHRRLDGEVDAGADGGIDLIPRFFVSWPKSHRLHLVCLQGGDLLVGILIAIPRSSPVVIPANAGDPVPTLTS